MPASQRAPTRAQQRWAQGQQELEVWQARQRFLQQIEQKWQQILHELDEEFLDREAFEGYRQGIRRLCLNNDYSITDGRLL
jgi:hypothetical protein